MTADDCITAVPGIKLGHYTDLDAGTGATVGKISRPGREMKGGIGTACLDLGEGLRVGAAVVTNPIGGIYDPESGAAIAGPLAEDGTKVLDTMAVLASPDYRPPAWMLGANTTIGVVATNARLDSRQANKLASVAHDGLALAVRPAHTELDGDTLFCLATRMHDGCADMTRLIAAAVTVTAGAVANGVRAATGLFGVPAARDLAGR